MTVIEAPVIDPIADMPLDPFMDIMDVPKSPTNFTYTGTGAAPVWDDVYNAAKTEYLKGAPLPGNAKTDPFFKYAQNTGLAAVGESLKAASSFINDVASAVVDGDNAVLGIMNANLLEVNRRFSLTGNALREVIASNNFIARYVIPNLQAQITKLGDELPALVRYLILIERAWTEENIFKPLYTELLKVQPAIDASIKANNQVVLAAAQSKVNALHDTLLPQLAALTAGIAALQTENDTCTQPMCDTMGPKTNLGKLLKGLSLALDAGLLLEIANAKESDVADAVTRIAQHAATVIDTFETSFLQGGDTLAQLVGREIGNVI